MRRLLSLFLLVSGAALGQPAPQAYGPGIAPTVGTPGNLAYFGPGGLPADSTYSYLLGRAYLGRSEVVPRLHLKKMAAAAAPIVAFLGDSRISLAANQIALTETLQYKLRRRIMEDNPDKTWSFTQFNDLSIGGTTWAAWSGSIPGSTFPAWYLNHNIGPLPYAMAANPDTVFINLGANDADYLDPIQVKAVLATIASWGTAPATWVASTAKGVGSIITDSSGRLQVAVVAGTTGAAVPAWGGTYSMAGQLTTDGSVTWMQLANYGSNVYVPKTPDVILVTTESMSNRQSILPSITSGYLTAASFVRTTAMANAGTFGITGLPYLGLIDIGRFQIMARDGVDVVDQYLTQVAANLPSQPFVSNVWNAPAATQGDFDLQVTFAGQGNILSPPGILMTVIVGETFNNTNQGPLQQSTLNISSNGGRWLVQYYSGNGMPLVDNGGQNPLIPTTGDVPLEVTVKQSHLIVSTGGYVLIDRLVPRFVGPFTPSIISSVSTGVTLNSYSAGTPASLVPVITDAQLFGPVTGGSPQGGAFPGHWTSYGESLIDDVVLNATRLSSSEAP